VVKRENVELTSDFTATINADMKVGAVEETITVSAESPVVDTQSITTRTVMTREVLDAIPTGRNIQAVGIMIPGTTIAVGGGGAISRDVGGSGNLQQSPLQFHGSADTVQTVEGIRLNNLCANGAYSGVYWNDQSLQEISYVTGADSAEMGQGGIRVNMVPRDGGNRFRGVVFGNYTPKSWGSDNCGSAGVGQACSQANLTGDTTFNKTSNFLTNVSVLTKNYDFSPSVGGPGHADELRVGVEVDPDTDEQAPVRRRPRRLRSGISGELSAGGLRGLSAARHDHGQQHWQDRERLEQPGGSFLQAVHRIDR